ncbi:MAG: glycoside hydrolase family 127 protein, partial [Firmicutes bacterium]|nr:glycoside hydrolase family 127 protein [Bacillota bacterium]
YNGVAAGVQLDGKAFFYVNPLEAIPGVAGETVNHSHVRIERAKWFACACCPPNAARLFTSLGRYAWGIGEDTLYSHLLIAGELDLSDTHGVKIRLETEYPVEGTLRYHVVKADRKLRLAVRIPAWSQNHTIRINGEPAHCMRKDGYAYLDALRSGDTVTVALDLRPRRVYPSGRIAANSGRVAFMRGPLVYCAEGVDNGGGVLDLSVAKDAPIEVLLDDRIGGVPKLRVQGSRQADGEPLYAATPPQASDCEVTLIPYFAWANRGVSAMRCFLPEKS